MIVPGHRFYVCCHELILVTIPQARYITLCSVCYNGQCLQKYLEETKVIFGNINIDCKLFVWNSCYLSFLMTPGCLDFALRLGFRTDSRVEHWSSETCFVGTDVSSSWIFPAFHTTHPRIHNSKTLDTIRIPVILSEPDRRMLL